MKTVTTRRWWLALAAVLCFAMPAWAQEHETPGAEPQHAAAGHGEGEVRSTRDMVNSDFFLSNFVHLMPHVVWQPSEPADGSVHPLAFYNVNLYQVYTVVGLLVLFFLVAQSFTKGESSVVIRVFRGWCHWLRDEVVYNVMGKTEGDRWAPLFIYIFFFVAFMNLVGLVPGSVTATACVFVTGALAVITFAVMVIGGMLKQGALSFWKHLLPPDLPLLLIPLMAFVEVIGLFVKPFALMIRLFANMLAGHLLIYSFIGLIFVFAKMLDLGVFSWATAVPTVAMAVFINIIEALVVILQAYIFTYLSVLFVQQSLHPEH